MRALFWRDLRIAFRAGGGAFIGILFYLAVAAVVPFAVGPDLKLLARIGPAMLWLGALLAILLGLDRLFQADREDGSLDVMIMAQERHFLTLTVMVKCLAHWVAVVLPLIVVAPFLGLIMNMELLAIGATVLTLLIGTPAVIFIGALGAALAVSMPRGGLLVSVMILPLTIPVLIFGVSAAYGAVTENAGFVSPLLLLAANTLIAAIIGPFAAAFALKISTD